MKQALHSTADYITCATAAAAILDRRLVHLRQQAEQWQRRAELALRAEQPKLARQAVARKLQLEKLIARYEQALAAQQRLIATLQTRAPQQRTRPAGAVRMTLEERFEALEIEAALQELRRTMAGVPQAGSR